MWDDAITNLCARMEGLSATHRIVAGIGSGNLVFMRIGFFAYGRRSRKYPNVL